MYSIRKAVLAKRGAHIAGDKKSARDPDNHASKNIGPMMLIVSYSSQTRPAGEADEQYLYQSLDRRESVAGDPLLQVDLEVWEENEIGTALSGSMTDHSIGDTVEG